MYGDRIIAQMKRLGNSCDWRRERFTLDEGLSRAVRAVFVRLYKKGQATRLPVGLPAFTKRMASLASISTR